MKMKKDVYYCIVLSDSQLDFLTGSTSLTVTKPDGGRLTLLPNGMGRVSPTVPPSMTVART